MDLVATTLVSETAIHARFADCSNLARARQWFEFEVPLADIGLRTVPDRPASNSEARFITEAKLAALRYLHGVIAAEIERLSEPPASDR
ncbi:hypothetical protein A33M_0256 [Rhodovulum sp. PH10]|uniref:hypothetical protein n=1 Tax=Rhodovulum sp. PH10 TaxID=1187851 RepID=UPI00027C23EB|nr:hypothetical protein [Rhodovulum sp. PH10]EJW10319.1 hypothetical protein A33M_0256 [Rhodovulum sp. PH10]